MLKKKKRVTITELNQIEVNRLLSDTVYSRFAPIKCYTCGVKKGFNRRIFHISGIQKDNQADDNTQNMLRYHFFHQNKIECIFFRTNAGKFYVDSATCQTCKSMNVVFDIALDDRLMAEYAKVIGSNTEIARTRVEAIVKELESEE